MTEVAVLVVKDWFAIKMMTLVMVYVALTRIITMTRMTRRTWMMKRVTIMMTVMMACGQDKYDDKLARMTRLLTEWQWWRQWWQGWWPWWWRMWPWQGWRRRLWRVTCPQAEVHNPVVCHSHSVLQYPCLVLTYTYTYMCIYAHIYRETHKHKHMQRQNDKHSYILAQRPSILYSTFLQCVDNKAVYRLVVHRGHQRKYQCQQDRSRLSADLFNPLGNCCICFISFHLAQHDPATTSSAGQHPMNHHCPIVQQIGCEQLLSGPLTLSIWDNLCFECFVNSATSSWLHNGLTSI